MYEKTSILYHQCIAKFFIIYIRLITSPNVYLYKRDMPLNHIYQIWELNLLVFNRINGNKKLCLSTESAIANHKLFNIVWETVIPCLSFLLGIKLELDTDIFTDTKLLLSTSWSDPAVEFWFWLSLITSSKCSETTHLSVKKSSLHYKHCW